MIWMPSQPCSSLLCLELDTHWQGDSNGSGIKRDHHGNDSDKPKCKPEARAGLEILLGFGAINQVSPLDLPELSLGVLL